MKIEYRKAKLSRGNKERLVTINEIIEEYKELGYTLTLRQLYYQLVSKDIIPNSDKEYDKLGVLLKEGRMSGQVDWDAIEDRLRKPSGYLQFESIKQRVETSAYNYALDRMQDQKVYIETWVEKDALSAIINRACAHYHIPTMVNRGYSSVTAMHDAFQRFHWQINNNKKCYILYVGDHDPSGLDMIRDIKDRLIEFDDDFNYDWYFEILPIALTKSQIKTYNPPPNPAKITDTRASNYIEIHGDSSWEVDALRPEVLEALIKSTIENLVDIEKINGILEKEESDKQKLRELIDFL